MTQRDTQLGVHRAINHRLPVRLRNREFSNVSFASPRRRYRYATRRPRKGGGKTVEPYAHAVNTPVPPPVSFSVLFYFFFLRFSLVRPLPPLFFLSLSLFSCRSSSSYTLSAYSVTAKRTVRRRVEIPRSHNSLRLSPQEKSRFRNHRPDIISSQPRLAAQSVFFLVLRIVGLTLNYMPRARRRRGDIRCVIGAVAF